ncbi:MAG: hypothetical protein B7Z40_02460 [Bosea sp. 12-68-7]|nr:MAG: hypothetical protein B7Z40_02460 [Bosea sp. 12-68-7]OYW98335.1 MAG: hypothetical protein B7Z14_15180 [Bosea sp. 32-68-6]
MASGKLACCHHPVLPTARPGRTEVFTVARSQEAVMLLMTFATKSLSSVSAGATRVVTLTFKPVNAIVKALIHRREVMRLGELDERALKDIGLVRSDLDGALSVSWLSDPSLILAERSSARHGVASLRRQAALQQAERVAPSQPVVPTRPVPVAPARRAAVAETVACSA